MKTRLDPRVKAHMPATASTRAPATIRSRTNGPGARVGAGAGSSSAGVGAGSAALHAVVDDAGVGDRVEQRAGRREVERRDLRHGEAATEDLSVAVELHAVRVG